MRALVFPVCLAATLLGGCIYLPDHDPLEDLGQGDVTGVAVGRLEGIQSSSAVPLQGVRVQLGGSIQRSTTDGNGRFTLRNLPEGNHLLILTVGLTDQPRATLRFPFRVRSVGGQRAAVNLGRLELVAPGALHGTINVVGGGALDQVRVAALEATTTSALDGRTAVVPNADGSFLLQGLGPGSWRALAVLGARTALSGTFPVVAGDTTELGALNLEPLSAPSGASVQLNIHAPPNVTGPVTVQVQLTPAPGTSPLGPCSTAVDLNPQDGPQTTVVTGCNAGGPYRLEIASDGTFLPWVQEDVLLTPDLNDLGNVYLTLPQDCADCIPTESPDAGASGSSSSGSSLTSSSANASSSSANASSSSGGVEIGTLAPSVSGLTAFNSWVSNVGAALPPVANVPCPLNRATNLSNCQHVGVYLRMSTNLANCNNVTVADTDGMGGASVLEWVCIQGNTVDVVSTGFAQTKSLADLVDWTFSPPRFRTDFRVEVRLNDVLVAQSTPAAPWSDAFTEDPTAAVDLATHPAPHLVVALRSPLPRTSDLEIARSNVAITVDPALASVDLGPFFLRVRETASQVYVEGSYVGDDGNQRIRLGESGLAPLEAVRIHALTAPGLYMQNVAGVYGRRVNLHASNTFRALMLDGATSHVDLQRVQVLGGTEGVSINDGDRISLSNLDVAESLLGINISNTAPNTGGSVMLHDVAIQDVMGDGILITGSNDVRMSSIQVANASSQGVRMQGCVRCVLIGGAFSNNGIGLQADGSNGTVLRGLVLAHNTSEGLSLLSGDNMLIAEVTAANNGTRNLNISGLTNSVVSRVLSVGAGQEGIVFNQLSAPSPSNVIYDLASANNGSTALSILNATTAMPVLGTLTLGPIANPCDVNPPYDDLGAGCTPAGMSVFSRDVAADLAPGLLGPTDTTVLSPAMLAMNHTWRTTPFNPLRVWGEPGVSGRCTNCQLLDYSLFSTSPVLNIPWANMETQRPHTFPLVSMMAECTLLGGTFGSLCIATHQLEMSPLPNANAAVTTGLCVARPTCMLEPLCNCTRVANVGAYQGHNGLTAPALQTVAAGQLQIHAAGSNGY